MEFLNSEEKTQLQKTLFNNDLLKNAGLRGDLLINRQWELVAIHQGHPGIGRQVIVGTVGGIPIYAIWNQISSHVC